MQKFNFHNSRPISENIDKIQTYPTQYQKKKIVVDINKLLNRVKMEERNEKKKKNYIF